MTTRTAASTRIFSHVCGRWSCLLAAAALVAAAAVGIAAAGGGAALPRVAAGATGAESCPSSPVGPELLRDPRFEQPFRSSSPAWGDNRWNGSTASYSRTTRGPHGGSAAQVIRVGALPPGSGMIFKQDVTLRAGRTYHGSVWLRSPDAAVVQFKFRRAGPHYESAAVQQVRLRAGWHQYRIRGGFDTDVKTYFAVDFASRGTVEVDDASLREVSESSCVVGRGPVPDRYFGIHVNKWGTYRPWPSYPKAGLVRLWDTGTSWRDIEPARGVWDWSRLDYYVDVAVKSSQDIVYTMGQTPRWSSARPAEMADGAAAEPGDIEDWRAYVRAVAERYRGKIKYWEIWNEASVGTFYSGSPERMVELTAVARRELRSTDPRNVLLGPSFTATGLDWFARYLSAGGGPLIDVVSVHRYTPYSPEADAPFFVGVEDAMQNHGVAAKPLWNTEGATYGPPVSVARAAGTVAREYLLQWSWGVGNFTWYGWDIDLGNPLSRPGHVQATASGVAYREVGEWLRGSSMVSKHRDGSGTWVMTLTRPDGSASHVAWNPAGPATLALPPVWRASTRRDLAGAVTSLRGASRVAVGESPVLLQ